MTAPQSRPHDGRTAFVSGSGRNIGRAIARRLAQQGCNVVINGASNRDACDATAKLVEAEGTRALIAMGDMGKAEDLARITDAALTAFGRIDILVNNAAIRPHKIYTDMSDDDWFAVVDTSLTASFRTARAFLPGMVGQGWGRIVSMTGMKAMQGYFEGAPISAAKHGIWGLTKALSTEFAGKGITVNAISPGQIATEGRDPTNPKILATIPAGFMGQPEDIAAAVAFFAAPEARFVTGQMLGVNGGQAT